jgi:rRNA-processing protein FCF1
VALDLARRALEFRCEGTGDQAVFDAAVRSRAWVLTADRGLADRLRAAGLGVVVPRDRTRLVAHGPGPPHPGPATVKKRPPVGNSPRRNRSAP